MGNTNFVSAANTGNTGVYDREHHLYEINNNAKLFQLVLTGTVLDESGVPIPNVTIKVESAVPNRATATNSDGKYSIQINNDSEVLVFSYVGYTTQRITVGNKKMLDITLLGDDKNSLEEVAVVAFGTQKKADLVGSVVSVKVSDLKIPSSNLTTALAGRIPGIIAFQRGAEPGNDNANFFIRGVTTFGYNNDPLILIDNMEVGTTELARLQTDDIASFSVMKDATSTALYGVRGANGVILITTKQGAVGKAQISFRVESSISSSVQDIELADPVTYMMQANEAVLTRNPLGQVLYSDEKIANTGVGENPIIYPANDWRSLVFKDYTANQRYNLNVSGGGEVAKYFVSGSLNKDNGLLKVDTRNNFNNNIDLTSYSLRSNVNINLTRTTEMMVRLSGNFDEYTGPIDGGAEMYRKVMRTNPVLFPQYYPVDEQHQFVKHIMFGNSDVGGRTYTNPYADLVRGYKDSSRSLMLAQLELKQDLSFFTQGLNFQMMANTNRTSFFDVTRAYNPYYYNLIGYDPADNTYAIDAMNEDSGTEYLNYNPGSRILNSVFYAQSQLNYSRSFNKHGVSALLVTMLQNNLSANGGDLQQSLPSRNMGVSGRATYNYDSRYYLEYNFGYNGSERFASK